MTLFSVIRRARSNLHVSATRWLASALLKHKTSDNALNLRGPQEAVPSVANSSRQSIIESPDTIDVADLILQPGIFDQILQNGLPLPLLDISDQTSGLPESLVLLDDWLSNQGILLEDLLLDFILKSSPVLSTDSHQSIQPSQLLSSMNSLDLAQYLSSACSAPSVAFENLYGDSTLPILRPELQSFILSGFEHSSLRRQKVLELCQQKQAFDDYIRMNREIEERGGIAVCEGKRLFVRWVKDMATELDNLSKKFNQQLTKTKISNRFHSFTQTPMPLWMQSRLSPEVLAVATARTVISLVCTPNILRKDQEESANSRINQNNHNFQIIYKNVGSMQCPDEAVAAEHTATEDFGQSSKTASCKFARLCIEIGESINTAYNAKIFEENHSTLGKKFKANNSRRYRQNPSQFFSSTQLAQLETNNQSTIDTNPFANAEITKWDEAVRLAIGAELLPIFLPKATAEISVNEVQQEKSIANIRAKWRDLAFNGSDLTNPSTEPEVDNQFVEDDHELIDQPENLFQETEPMTTTSTPIISQDSQSGQSQKAKEQRMYRVVPGLVDIAETPNPVYGRWPKPSKLAKDKAAIPHVPSCEPVTPEMPELQKPEKTENGKTLVSAFEHKTVYRKGRMQGEICLRPSLADRFLVLDNKSRGTSNLLVDLSSLRLTPSVVPAIPWKAFTSGAYMTHRVPFVKSTGSKMNSNDAKISNNHERTMKVINYLGETAWKINPDTYTVMNHVWQSGIKIEGLPERFPRPILPEMSSHEKALVYEANDKMIGQRATFLTKLNFAKTFLNAPKFYFPHNVDFRGRAYPLPVLLNHQCDDSARGLLLFAEGRRLGLRGLYWLKVHVANLFGKDKLTFTDRCTWTEQNLHSILRAAKDPVSNVTDWSQADDPWQALATCIEIRKAALHAIGDSPKTDIPTDEDLIAALTDEATQNFVSHLPVHQDGSCNGLQHYAALGRDELGARAVNVLPSDKVEDVYTFVLDIVKQKIQRVAQGEFDDSENSSWLTAKPEQADQFRRLAQWCIEKDILSRKVVKTTVMTICYGVTLIGARDQVDHAIREILENRKEEINRDEINKASMVVARLILDSIDEVFADAMNIKRFFDECSRVMSACGLPTCWINPMGLPCRQPYRKDAHVIMPTELQKVKLAIDNDTEPVSKQKQRLGFPPNFVHSLDASHMAMTAEKCEKEGLVFATVHDSFWTHACDVDIMSLRIREAFVEMHSQTILGDLKRTLEITLGKDKDLLPKIPAQGKLDITQVIHSPYFFD